MKSILLFTAAAITFAATPAMADTISAEVRFGDVRSGQSNDSTEYRVDYSGKVARNFNYGAELTVKQGNNEGPLGSKLAARVGPQLPTVLGFNSQAYGEIGVNLQQGRNYMFWGAGAKTSHTLYGPVSVSVGYRHREAFRDTGRLTENRVDAGLAYALDSKNNVAAKYYRTTGTTRSDTVGIQFNHSF